MCLAPKLALPAAPPPLPTSLDAGVLSARATQRTKQKKAGGYNGQSLLSGGDMTAMPASPMKTLLGG